MDRSTLTRKGSTACLLVLFLLLFIPAQRAEAQLGDAGEILRAGAHDANLLMESYLRPFGAGFGADLNSGWVNTAGAYKPFGFDLRVNAALSFVPETDQLFSIGELSLQQMQLMDGSSPFSPTISGENQTGSYLFQSYTDPISGQEEELFGFNMPQGTGFPYVPAPMAQLTIGLVKDTDVSIRYFPTYEVPDVASIGLWGLGIKHELNQWIPGGNLLPIDLSVQFGYTQINASANFDVQPQIDDFTEVPAGYEAGAARWQGQGIDLKANGYTGNLLIGKTLPILSLFAGVGMQASSISIQSPGSYPITEMNPDMNAEKPKIISSINQPVDLNLDGANSFHTLAGFRIRLAILTISGSYTHSTYPVANLGVGLSLR